MKLFVFSIEENANPYQTLLDAPATIYRIRTLLGGGHSLWEDDDPLIEQTEESILNNYLKPNNIPIKAMGKLPEPATYWAIVDEKKLNFDDFYTYEEAQEADIFTADPTALCWKQFYIFLHAETKADIIGSYSYLGVAAAPAKYIIENVLSQRVSSV
jgi:hypothetical protein